jgi:alcohol dehydrogenase class IV
VVAFEFATANRIVFGRGKIAEVPASLRAQGVRRALLATNLPGEAFEKVNVSLAAVGLEAVVLSVQGEPTVDLVQTGRERCRQEGCEAVIGLGGGSAMDTAKAVAGLATNSGDILDYLEVVGLGRPLTQEPLPIVAIPTTAGTGAEVTRNAVLGVPAAKVKVSLRSPWLLPGLAVLDPDLLDGLPAAVIAHSGLDAFSHLMESLVSCRANPLTDALAVEGLRHCARSLRKAFLSGMDRQTGESLMLASLCGGLCLANGGLGAVHGFAAPLGGMVHAPHGAICACLLAPVMEANLRALAERAPEHPALARYRQIAGIVNGQADIDAEQGVAWVRNLCQDLGGRGLSRFGLQENDIPGLVAKAQAANSMRGNPVQLFESELAALARKAL